MKKIHIVKFSNNGEWDYVTLQGCKTSKEARQLFKENCKDPILSVKQLKVQA